MANHNSATPAQRRSQVENYALFQLTATIGNMKTHVLHAREPLSPKVRAHVGVLIASAELAIERIKQEQELRKGNKL